MSKKTSVDIVIAGFMRSEPSNLKIIERRIKEESDFLGIALWDVILEDLDEFTSRLKALLVSGIEYYGGNRIVLKQRDLSKELSRDDCVEKCRRYRTSYPNSLFLFYDPGRTFEGDGTIYTINYGRMVPRSSV